MDIHIITSIPRPIVKRIREGMPIYYQRNFVRPVERHGIPPTNGRSFFYVYLERSTPSVYFLLCDHNLSQSSYCYSPRSGYGKRRGTANACLPFRALWVRRTRVLRRLLKMMRDAKKIDKHIYHSLYALAKGNQFKNKRVLIVTIHVMKAVKPFG